MTIRVAINGFGRIGRNIVRALFEKTYINSTNNHESFEIVAINDLGKAEINAHLLKFDSVHGRFSQEVSSDDKHIQIGGQSIAYFNEKNITQLPWKELGIDVVFECTGVFRSKEAAGQHLEAGAQYVLVSAPGVDLDLTVCYGVNHHLLSSNTRIVSNASCTTNCLAPLVKILHDEIGIKQGLMTTVHAYTNDQSLADSYHKDPHRARAAALSLIPTKTGAAAAVGEVLPELKGRLDGSAIRVPTANVSMLDLSVMFKRSTTQQEINLLIKEASAGTLQGVLDFNDIPLVSIDFNHNPASSIFDATLTQCSEDLGKIFAWYDNEWGYSNRMLDTAYTWMMAVQNESELKISNA
ncbi:MAG: type I glyceraldehyde-3-phosphate dehydrogenase [Pseudomonadota bacterium]